MEKNKELQQTLKDLKGDKTLSGAAQAARDAADSAQRAASTAAEKASEAATKASTAASQAAEDASKASREFVGKTDAGAKADDATANATAGDGAKADGGAAGAKAESEVAKAGGEEAPKPLYERLMGDVSKLVSSLSETINQQSAAATGGKAAGPIDGDTSAVVVRPPSFWEKNFNQDSPLFGRFSAFFGKAGEVAGGAGDVADRVFGETEQAEAVRELKELVPDFRQ